MNSIEGESPSKGEKMLAIISKTEQVKFDTIDTLKAYLGSDFEWCETVADIQDQLQVYGEEKEVIEL